MQAKIQKPRNIGPKSKTPPSFSFYLLQSGYEAFKRRLREELLSLTGEQIEDCAEDETLYQYYHRGEPTSFVLERLCGSSPES